MVIVNSILERDETFGDVIWNTAVVISEKGKLKLFCDTFSFFISYFLTLLTILF